MISYLKYQAIIMLILISTVHSSSLQRNLSEESDSNSGITIVIIVFMIIAGLVFLDRRQNYRFINAAR